MAPPPPLQLAEEEDGVGGEEEEEEPRPVDDAALGFADDEAVDGFWDHQYDEL